MGTLLNELNLESGLFLATMITCHNVMSCHNEHELPPHGILLLYTAHKKNLLKNYNRQQASTVWDQEK